MNQAEFKELMIKLLGDNGNGRFEVSKEDATTIKNKLSSMQDAVINYMTKRIEDEQEFSAHFFNLIQFGQDEVVIKLVQKFPEKLLELTDQENSTPIIFAAAHGEMDLVKELVELGANCDAINKYEQNVLHYLSDGYLVSSESVKMKIITTIEKVMTSQNINQKNEDGRSPLYREMFISHPELIVHNLKLHQIEDCNGSIAKRLLKQMQSRESVEDLEIIGLLVKNFGLVDPKNKELNELMHAVTNASELEQNKRMEIDNAPDADNEKIIKDIECLKKIREEAGTKLFTFLASYLDEQVIKLVQQFPENLINIQGQDSLTLIMFFADQGKLKIVKELKKLNANCNLTDNKQQNILHHLANLCCNAKSEKLKHEINELMKKLTTSGNIMQKNYQDYTPLEIIEKLDTGLHKAKPKSQEDDDFGALGRLVFGSGEITGYEMAAALEGMEIKGSVDGMGNTTILVTNGGEQIIFGFSDVKPAGDTPSEPTNSEAPE